MPKLIRIECPPAIQTILYTAMREYAEAAWPPGGSECAQVARAAMSDAAENLQTSFANNKSYAELSRRMRATVTAAIEYYCEQHQQQSIQALLLQLLEGNPVSEQDLPDNFSQ